MVRGAACSPDGVEEVLRLEDTGAAVDRRSLAYMGVTGDDLHRYRRKDGPNARDDGRELRRKRIHVCEHHYRIGCLGLECVDKPLAPDSGVD